MTKGASHCIVAITHGHKWVVGNTTTINGEVANKPSSGCQGYQKGPSGKRIALGNPDFADMVAIDAFLHMMPPEQLELMMEFTCERLATKGKMELTRQELLRWIGMCIMNPSINFWGDRCNLWEGSPPTTCMQQVSPATASMTSGMQSGGIINHPSSQRVCHLSHIVGC